MRFSKRRYENLSVNFISHHNPDLVIFDDSNVETERIPLNELTLDEIHNLVLYKGFSLKNPVEMTEVAKEL